MDKAISLVTCGWLVEVIVSTEHGGAMQQLLYAAALSSANEATEAVSKTIDGRPCCVEAKCGFSPRALAGLGVRRGQIMELGSIRTHVIARP
jgi:hypothetical protein